MYNNMTLAVILMGICLLSACTDNKQETTIPTIETEAVTNISITTATCGGSIVTDGGEPVISKGICWNIVGNPSIKDSTLINDDQSVSFTSAITNLMPSTTYYVCAYATNSNGTAYGEVKTFTTLSEKGNDYGDPTQTQIILWPDGNMPATTVYTTNPNNQYFDDPEFRPYMVYFPVKEGVGIKGAVLICAGGAFQFRSDSNEGTPVARALSELGYHSFVVNYRLRPYTQQEGALDLARAVRFVRAHAEYYGIRKNDIAVMGFSAGGILCGEMVLNFKGTINGSSLDSGYTPDELDKISANVSAIGHIYSFYGRLSVASTNAEQFRNSNLPPAFFCYGTQDPFVGQFGACVNALRQANVPVETHILQDWPHGYGYRGDWIPVFDNWLLKQFQQ